LTDISETLRLISDRFGAFKIELKDDTVCYIVKFLKATKNSIIIQEIDAKAKWVETEKYKFMSIITIEFDRRYSQ
jgi:hypothetical protein